MAFHKGLLQGGFLLPWCERHFHDSDETWVVLEGRGTGYWIDHDGRREEFELEAGDVDQPCKLPIDDQGLRSAMFQRERDRCRIEAGI